MADQITIEQQLAELTTMVKTQGETINKQAETIAGLKGQVTQTAIATKKPELPKIPTDAVKVGGKSYKWNVPHFNLGGKTITAEDASTDEKLMLQLVATKGQGLLKEQV